MSYQCKACGRRLNLPAYTAPAWMGGWVLGPVCAEKSGLLPGKRRPAALPPPARGRARAAKPARPHPMACPVLEGQLPLFDPVTAPALARAHNL